MNDLHIEKWLTFTLIDGKWDMELWADNAKPVSGKVLSLPVGLEKQHCPSHCQIYLIHWF